MAEHKLSNVEYVLATESSPRLPERSVDLVFIAYAYHEFGDPDAMMAAIKRALRPGGRVVILEYAKESNIAPASPLHKMSFEEIRREIEPMGFVIDQLLDFLPVQHGVDLHNKVAELFDRKSGRPTYPCGRTVPLVNSLLTAIVRANGDALVLHAGERPYVIAPSGQLELASRALTLEAVKGMLNELLPVEARQALDDIGAVQHELGTPAFAPGQTFSVVAARGGEDIWIEIRRHRAVAVERPSR